MRPFSARLPLMNAGRDSRPEDISLRFLDDSAKDRKYRNLESSDSGASGVSWKLFFLFIQGGISIAWGAALFVFSLGFVPIYYGISERGKVHETYTNIIVTLIASISTMHIKYVLQESLQEYSHFLAANGFTLNDLRWMQGIGGMSIFANFASPKNGGIFGLWPKKRVLWIVASVGFGLHSASVAAILQPKVMFKHVWFNDRVPCGQDLSNLTLGPDPFLSVAQQKVLDVFSFNIGLQVGSYSDQVYGNTTFSAAGRNYRRDNFAYGAVGGLVEGLQEIPGVQFAAQCSDDTNNALSVWKSAFPHRSPPTVSTLPDGSHNFSDSPIPSQLQSVVSEAGPFNVTDNHGAMYGLVDPSGSGAFLSISPNLVDSTAPLTFVCSWKALPKIVHVQMVNFTALALSSDDDSNYPSPIGRATLSTLEGMAQAFRLGASLHGELLSLSDTIPSGGNYDSKRQKPPSQVLETLLADGGKASMTIYNVHFWNGAAAVSVPPLCNSHNRTVAQHWRFGDSHNLGWIAIIWTLSVGFLGVGTSILLRGRKRLEKIKVLDVAEVLALAREGATRDDEVLYVRNGVIVQA